MFLLTLYTISMRILPPVLLTFLMDSQGEFVAQSRASCVGGHFLYSHNHNVSFISDDE